MPLILPFLSFTLTSLVTDSKILSCFIIHTDCIHYLKTSELFAVWSSQENLFPSRLCLECHGNGHLDPAIQTIFKIAELHQDEEDYRLVQQEAVHSQTASSAFKNKQTNKAASVGHKPWRLRDHTCRAVNDGRANSPSTLTVVPNRVVGVVF